MIFATRLFCLYTSAGSSRTPRSGLVNERGRECSRKRDVGLVAIVRTPIRRGVALLSPPKGERWSAGALDVHSRPAFERSWTQAQQRARAGDRPAQRGSDDPRTQQIAGRRARAAADRVAVKTRQYLVERRLAQIARRGMRQTRCDVAGGVDGDAVASGVAGREAAPGEPADRVVEVVTIIAGRDLSRVADFAKDGRRKCRVVAQARLPSRTSRRPNGRRRRRG